MESTESPALLSVSEIRFENFKRLFEKSKFEYEGDFCESIGLHRTYMSLWKKGSDDGGKDMGGKLARKIEVALKLPKNWLDSLHEDFEFSWPNEDEVCESEAEA